MLSEVEDHFNPSVRILELERKDAQSCGFHLTRGKWDPYPWVARVDENSAAHEAGMVPGDCLLQVNGEDVVGKRISEVAHLVKSQPQVHLLLWNAGADVKCSPQESLCCGPMPNNFQRLSASMSSILSFLECPVCLDTTPPPAYQCDNGHIICMHCRAKSDKCPVCRVRFGRAKCLFADQVYNSVTDAFELRNVSAQLRDAKIRNIFSVKSRTAKNHGDAKAPQVRTNKFLSRLVGKSSSVENLSSKSRNANVPTNVDHEFSAPLRKKSLSTNELFTTSPSVSRSTSMNTLPSKRKLEFNSLESIPPQEILCHCPYSLACHDVLIKAFDIVQHFQTIHFEDPLVQYFKSKVVLNWNEKSETYLFNLDEKMFFLKFQRDSETNVSNNENSDTNVKIWLWILGDSRQALEYQLQINVINRNESTSSGREKIAMSMRIPAYSLQTVSAVDIRDNRKGVFIDATTLRALGRHLSLEAEIVKAERN